KRASPPPGSDPLGAAVQGIGDRLLEDIDDAASADPSGAAPGPDAPTAGATPDPNAPTRPASGSDVPAAGFGPTAQRVHREQVCLEVCPSSNLQTGAAADLASH